MLSDALLSGETQPKVYESAVLPLGLPAGEAFDSFHPKSLMKALRRASPGWKLRFPSEPFFSLRILESLPIRKCILLHGHQGNLQYSEHANHTSFQVKPLRTYANLISRHCICNLRFDVALGV